jgi:hypothetical protein
MPLEVLEDAWVRWLTKRPTGPLVTVRKDGLWKYARGGGLGVNIVCDCPRSGKNKFLYLTGESLDSPVAIVVTLRYKLYHYTYLEPITGVKMWSKPIPILIGQCSKCRTVYWCECSDEVIEAG